MVAGSNPVNSVYKLFIFSFCLLIIFFIMVELLLSGIILGLVFVTILGLFFAAYLQYIRSSN